MIKKNIVIVTQPKLDIVDDSNYIVENTYIKLIQNCEIQQGSLKQAIA